MIISIPINYICNLSCKYCYFQEKSTQKLINKYIIRKILNNISNNYWFKKKSFFIDMKEPLLHQDLIILLIEKTEEIFFNNYEITIFTNWTIDISEVLFNFLLKRHKKISFHFSLDGINNYERWVDKKQFIKIINNIRKIKKYFHYNIWYVVDDYTSQMTFVDILKIYIFFIKLNFLNVNFYRKRIIWIKSTLEEYSYYLDNFFIFKQNILIINKKRQNNKLQILNDTHMLQNIEYWCGTLRNNMIAYDLVWEKNFCSESIWQWEKLFNLTLKKVEVFRKEKCDICELKRICNSPCILEWEYKCLFYKKLYNLSRIIK